jgi:hypothetical protein
VSGETVEVVRSFIQKFEAKRDELPSIIDRLWDAGADYMLTGFTAAFIICSLVLMGGQSHQAVGTEWFVVATVAAMSYVHNYVQAARRGGSRAELRPYRLAGGTACYVAEMVGAVCLDFRPCCGSLCRRGRIGHPFRLHDFWSLVAARGCTRGQIAPGPRRVHDEPDPLAGCTDQAHVAVGMEDG